MSTDRKLQFCLLFIRLAVFLDMLMWTIDKFANPARAAGIFASRYGLSGLNAPMMYVIGLIELIVLLMFVVGFKKVYSYGAVLMFQAVFTLAAWRQYFDPLSGSSLYLFSAWPMLAACTTLFLLRHKDRQMAMS